MKVGDLKRLLNGIPDNTPLYVKNHDNGEYENSGQVAYAAYLNQHNAHSKIDDCHKIDGDYFIISA